MCIFGQHTLPGRLLPLHMIDRRDTCQGSKHWHPASPVCVCHRRRYRPYPVQHIRADTWRHEWTLTRTSNRTLLTITGPRGHQNGHHLHKHGVRCPEGTHNDTSGRHYDPARIQISGRLGAMASRGHVAYQSGAGWRNVVRSGFVVLLGCGTIFRTSFQSRKGGDMACVRGPLDTLCQVRA